ncbi:MAG: PorT family protein [Candidatus Azobacteroides sp.]|nr:PorT family protein [Candidatus Azobacteroides sp.]
MKQFSKQMQILTICFFLLGAFSSFLNAQTKFGLQIGTSYDFENNNIGNYNFGAFLKVPVSTHWTIEPSLNIFPLGSETTTTSSQTVSMYSNVLKKQITTTINKTTTQKYNAISANIPIFAAYRFSLSNMFSLQFGVGPYVSYLFPGTFTTTTTTKEYQSANNSTSTKTDEMENDTKGQFSWGGMLRVGLLINDRFSVNIDYEGYDSVSKEAFNSKSLMLRLGYQF